MKLACKCGKPLTRDLYLTHKWRVDESATDYYGDGITKHFLSVTPGAFMLFKPTSFGKSLGYKTNDFAVNSDDVLDCEEQFEYKTGKGCCGVNSSLNCPSCNNEIGSVALDCYQHKAIYFEEDKVRRIYK